MLDKALGPVKSRIMGKFAKGTLPAGTPQKFDLKGMSTVMPFIIKGILLGKSKSSPFFNNGEAIVAPTILTLEERTKVTPKFSTK